jgi:hypothetical protein
MDFLFLKYFFVLLLKQCCIVSMNVNFFKLIYTLMPENGQG